MSSLSTLIIILDPYFAQHGNGLLRDNILILYKANQTLSQPIFATTTTTTTTTTNNNDNDDDNDDDAAGDDDVILLSLPL